MSARKKNQKMKNGFMEEEKEEKEEEKETLQIQAGVKHKRTKICKLLGWRK